MQSKLRCKEIESLVKVLVCFVTYKIEVKSGLLSREGEDTVQFPRAPIYSGEDAPWPDGKKPFDTYKQIWILQKIEIDL